MAITATKKETKKKICPVCKKEKPIATGFYKSSSPLFALDGCVPICIDCVKNDVVNEDGTVNENKLKTMCQRLDKPFYSDELDSAFLQAKSEHGYLSDDEIAKYGNKIVGFYFKNINTLRQNKDRSFADSEKDGFVHKTYNVNARQKKETIANRYTDIKEKKSDSQGVQNSDGDVKWTKKDKQNMKYVISVVGYDPFEDLNLSEYDKKYCFNILAGYCDAEGISEDGHKIQCVIQLTNLYCQCRKIDESINLELSKNDVDETKISKLTSSKSSILSSIATIAKDNNIASNYNKNSGQGKNTLSAKMKEIVADGFENMKVNLFDIDTSACMKQIADLSNQSIMEQLTFDSNEYTEMIKEQREMLIKLQNENERLEEENRILKNKVEDLENRKR